MIKSIAYKASQVSETSTFKPSKMPLFQILAAKIMVVLFVLLIGGLCPQETATMFITIGSSLQFWLTKNVGRKYLQAAWSIDTTQQEQVWVYEANFKSPASFQQIFWYSQVIYGIILIAAVIMSIISHKFSLLCSVIIAFTVNYVNFFAFSKIILLRNAGIFQRIADDANAQGELRQTIRLPLIYKSNSQNVLNNQLSLNSINRSSYA